VVGGFHALAGCQVWLGWDEARLDVQFHGWILRENCVGKEEDEMFRDDITLRDECTRPTTKANHVKVTDR
jgi:hypothetical protein